MKKFIGSLVVIIILLFSCSYFLNNNRQENVVKFSSWGSQSEVEILQNILDDFEKETDINVEFIHIPQNYFQKIHLLFASNLEPDVVFINNQYIKMYAAANLLEDLTDTFNNEIKEYYPQAIDGLKYNDKLYAIPRDISNLVLYVNKDILKEKGIKYKEKINTLEELQELLKTLTDKNHFGVNYEENSLFWLYYLAANGGGVLSDDLKNVILNKPESINAINFYADLSNKYHLIPTKSQVGSMTSAQMFINGKLALYLSGRWMVPKFRETISFDWDIIEFPSSSANKVYVDTSGWAISKNSKNKDNAIKLVEFLSSEKASKKFSESGLIIPARKSVANSYITNENKNPNHSKIFLTMLNNAKATPTNKNYNKINDILNEEVQETLTGSKRANDSFNNKVIKKIEDLL